MSSVNRIKESCKMIKNSITHLSTISWAFLGLLQPIRGNDFHTLRSEQFSYLIHPPGPSFLHQDLITLMKVLFKQASWLKTNAYIIRVAAKREKQDLYRHWFHAGTLLDCFNRYVAEAAAHEVQEDRWEDFTPTLISSSCRGRKKKKSYISKCRNVTGWCANRLFSFWKVSGLFLTPCLGQGYAPDVSHPSDGL